MGVSIQVAGANFTGSISSTGNPIRSGLTDEYFLGGTSAKSRHNNAPEGADATVTGSPTYAPYKAVLSDTAFLETQTLDSSSNTMTFIAVLKRAASDSLAMGSYSNGGNSDVGKNLGYTKSSESFNVTANGVLGVSTASLSASSVPADSYVMVIGQWVSNQLSIQAYLTAGNVSAASGQCSNTAIARKIRLGKAYANTYGPTDMAYSAIYNRLTTSQENTDIYSFLKSYFNGKLVMV